MPRYDYFCPSNGQVVEATHSITTSVATWGDLCALAGLDVGDTALGAPVERLMGTPPVFRPGSPDDLLKGAPPAHAHGPGCSCCSPPSNSGTNAFQKKVKRALDS